MASEGTSKPSSTKSTATRPEVPPPSDALHPTTDAMIEDRAVFVKPLAMVLTVAHDGGLRGAAPGSADPLSRPTMGRDTARPHFAARSASSMKV